MKNVVSFSGGRTSAYLVHLMQKTDSDAAYIFCDTEAEHPKTYEFIRNVVKHWGIELICLRAKVSPEEGVGVRYEQISIDDIQTDLKAFGDLTKKYSTPYVHGAFCSERMKKDIFDRYCKEHFGKDFVTWLGIRADEPRRLNARQGVKFLADISDCEKLDILRWWKRQPFDLDLMEHLGNCVFCIKKGLGKLALAARDEPELAEQFMTMIDEAAEVRGQKRIDRGMDKGMIYRGYQSLGGIIATFSSHSRSDIVATLKNSHRYESECSESCEPYQQDLFKEI